MNSGITNTPFLAPPKRQINTGNQLELPHPAAHTPSAEQESDLSERVAAVGVPYYPPNR